MENQQSTYRDSREPNSSKCQVTPRIRFALRTCCCKFPQYSAQKYEPCSQHDQDEIKRDAAQHHSLAFAGKNALSTQPRLEELFHPPQNLHRTLRLVDRLAQPCSAWDAMREPGGELLHLADGVREFLFDQHLEVGADHLV